MWKRVAREAVASAMVLRARVRVSSAASVVPLGNAYTWQRVQACPNAPACAALDVSLCSYTYKDRDPQKVDDKWITSRRRASFRNAGVR